jgi:hypothetical protein
MSKRDAAGVVKGNHTPAAAAAAAAETVTTNKRQKTDVSQALARAKSKLAEHKALCLPVADTAAPESVRARVRRECGIAPFFGAEVKVGELYELYDKHMDYRFSKALHAKGHTLRLGWENRSGSRAGVACPPRAGKTVHTILFSNNVFFRQVNETTIAGFVDAHGKTVPPLTCCGIKCPDRLTALMLTMEHELVHVLNWLDGHPERDIKKGHGPVFMRVARTLFGHTMFKHKLCCGYHKTADGTYHRFRLGERVQLRFRDKTVDACVQRLGPKSLTAVCDAGRARAMPYCHCAVVVVS